MENILSQKPDKKLNLIKSQRDSFELSRIPTNLQTRLYECKIRETEDILFDLLCDKKGKLLAINKFWQALELTGLRRDDPRLAEAAGFLQLVEEQNKTNNRAFINREQFRRCIQSNIFLINKSFKKEFVIPEFAKFIKEIDCIYEKCQLNTLGKCADYIPQLSRVDPSIWAVSACTIDGQRYSRGPCKTPFTIQSCSKPLNYSIALSDLGSSEVHNYVGQEPSGVSFNNLCLDTQNKPHNPMINSGAIVVTSLLNQGAPVAERFEYVSNQYKKMAGGEFIGFSNSTYLSERETADRNFALGYYMRENKCFPENTHLMQTLEFYFQLCSIEINTESGAVIAATLANGGICPITGERVLQGEAVRNTLSLMHSCGMYDYSGQFAFKVGLPAKSGVAGCILLVVPNVMGIACWAPPLDHCGNSCKGIQFCQELVNSFNFHNYDDLYESKKIDPRKRKVDLAANSVVSLLFGAANGDVTAIRRFALCGMDMRSSDYDGRTALHLAAAEGHLPVVRLLIERCHVPHDPKDRWGFTPLDDAQRFGHEDVAKYLENFAHGDSFAMELVVIPSPPTHD